VSEENVNTSLTYLTPLLRQKSEFAHDSAYPFPEDTLKIAELLLEDSLRIRLQP
jgi:hypothetical protein